MRPLAWTLLTELSHQRFVSGAKLAERFGVSRSAVSDALRDAAEAGVEIFSLTRKGYQLAQPLDLLDAESVRAGLGPAAKRLQVDICHEIDSTNSELMRRAEQGAAGGICLAAELQSAGRGRRGRSWQSGFATSLTFSFLWRSDLGAAALGGLSLSVGLAVVRALRELGVGKAMVKWPNDIVVGGDKLGGILIESRGDMLGPSAAVIGIGLNVSLPARLRAGIDQPVTDVHSQCASPPSRNLLLAVLLQHLQAVLDEFGKLGFSAQREEWCACHALHGKPVTVTPSQGTAYAATVVDVGNDGALWVRAAGKRLELRSAEVSLRARKADRA
ncbi:MAG: biotin--[acetyl-CoA-carboxylase] ligase [Betaproteobacteria bacterium]|nr:biotin--[acetyl-CoA-carboxylase] ligase [Betaproteobacteria bacterium]